MLEALQTTDGRAMKAYENRNLNFETGTIEPFRPTIANMYDGGECINEMVRRGLVEHKKSHSTYVTTSVGQYASARIKTLGFHWISRRKGLDKQILTTMVNGSVSMRSIWHPQRMKNLFNYKKERKLSTEDAIWAAKSVCME